MTQPLVSVVMCTFNGQQFIDEQVGSILNQDYKNLELVIVDDVSTDNTWEILESWQKKSGIIKLFKNEFNLGYNKNFEQAIQLANGEFIAISDQDDIWMPDKISKQVNLLKDDVVLCHNRSVRLENGRLRFKSASLHHHFKGNDTRRLFMFNQINGHDMVFKKELVDKVLPIPGGMMYDWWIAVIASCYGQIASVDEYLVHHRIHGKNNFFIDKRNDKDKFDLEDALRIFSTIKVLRSDSRIFLDKFLNLISEQNKKRPRFNFKLFLFFYQNGHLIFGHKKRLIPHFNYIKNAVKYAMFDFNNKGITF